jgi:cytochrome c oxidase subunit III
LSESQAILPTAVEHAHHDPDVAHQFDDMDQKNQTDLLGMWVFLATEVLFFGALVVSLMLYRSLYSDAFIQASHHLYQSIGMINTFVLLTSSYTVVLAVRAAKKGNNKQLITWLLMTMLLGLTFLGIKCYEYSLDFRDHLVPNTVDFGLTPEAAKTLDSQRGLVATDPQLWQQALKKSDWDVSTDPTHAQEAKTLIQHAQLFFVFYYTLTLIHALHMIVGLGIFTFLVCRALKGRYTPHHHSQIEISGLYWHFVDIVWIFLLPLLYLIR